MEADKTTPDIRQAILIGDLHCGSTVGLHPPDFVSAEGNQHPQNRLQDYIWECWADFHDSWVPEKVGTDPYAVIIMGDCIEGNHHGTTEIWSAEVGDHIHAATAALEPVADAATKTFVVRGTECHVGNAESHIGATIGAEKVPDTPKSYAADHWLVSFNGCLVSAQHHSPTGKRLGLKGTKLTGELAEEQLEAVRYGADAPTVVVRAHCHTFGAFTDGAASVINTPAWQAKTRFAKKVVPAAIPGFGGVHLDWRDRPRGAVPVVDQRLYRASQPKAVHL